MKKFIRNCLATTGMTLAMLAVIATCYGGQFIFVSSIYQSLLANIIIHFGFQLLKIFESKYFMLEVLLEMSYVFVVLGICGFLFQWYSSTPIWLVAIMGVIVYTVGCAMNAKIINDDVKIINQQIKMRREKIKM